MQKYMDALGYEACDKITGFKGVVASVSFDLYGCVQMVLTPGLDKDGKIQEGHWFDAKRLTISDKKVMDSPDFFILKAGDENGSTEKPKSSITHAKTL